MERRIQLNRTWLWNTIDCHFLSENSSVKVLEWTSVILAWSHTGTNYLYAAVWRVIYSFSFFAIIVTNCVCVLFFELQDEFKELTSKQRPSVHFVTLSISILLENSSLQNFKECSKLSPMPLTKRPYWMRPPCFKWWVERNVSCKCRIHNGKDCFDNCT